MPYYVYAIHPDPKINRLGGAFTGYLGAEIGEGDNQRSTAPQDDHFVMMIYAGNKTHAAQRIRTDTSGKRPAQKMKEIIATS